MKRKTKRVSVPFRYSAAQEKLIKTAIKNGAYPVTINTFAMNAVYQFLNRDDVHTIEVPRSLDNSGRRQRSAPPQQSYTTERALTLRLPADIVERVNAQVKLRDGTSRNDLILYAMELAAENSR